MSLKKYDELTEAEQKKIMIMYQFSSEDTVGMYLYNFDDNGNFHGRQFYVPDTTKEIAHLGSLHLTKDTPAEIEEKSLEEDVKEVTGKTQPVRKTKKTTKKK